LNPPNWPAPLDVPTHRDLVDNEDYFRLGGQLGVETKRGCGRPCVYCIDPLAKGRRHRLRSPAAVAEEIAGLAARGLDVLHFCDPEFNLPFRHAEQVCDELIQRKLAERVRWYAYLAVLPFSGTLANKMARAGCAGINFTSDAADPTMLASYRQPHRLEHLQQAVSVCREHGIAVMLDMLLGGPGETPETLATTVREFQRIDPDCAGAALGIRVYPGTPIESIFAGEGPAEDHPGLRRRYGGPVNLMYPTFFISPLLGGSPGKLVRELIGDDPRFFPPLDDAADCEPGEDHNYSENQQLVEAIARGERGAYWQILRNLRDR
jgi:radical SAM superfamily enzyme YgiQ (UPF0313 family)